jgi:transposase-like protein
VELRWLYDRHELEQARQDLAAWLVKWQTKYPKMCAWVEANIEETFTFYRLPAEHHKHMKSTNMLERINEELKRRFGFQNHQKSRSDDRSARSLSNPAFAAKRQRSSARPLPPAFW